ncbi:Hypothetical predicted protein [Xyrichtys novacula]|uniref:Uncharacterized protein n=1 Tax=Xyrichtys novacula TaxID=13765 RepID=A0AAV1GJ45_XYRNO|nr:Hypothetical predicted protein [Xyrichtys novacula]
MVRLVINTSFIEIFRDYSMSRSANTSVQGRLRSAAFPKSALISSERTQSGFSAGTVSPKTSEQIYDPRFTAVSERETKRTNAIIAMTIQLLSTLTPTFQPEIGDKDDISQTTLTESCRQR